MTRRSRTYLKRGLGLLPLILITCESQNSCSLLSSGRELCLTFSVMLSMVSFPSLGILTLDCAVG